MISLEQCRKILNQPELSDAEIEKIRQSFYETAELAWDVYKDKNEWFQKSL